MRWPSLSVFQSSDFGKKTFPGILADVLGIPETIRCEQDLLACDGLDDLCIVLRRLSFPCRYADMIPGFAKPVNHVFTVHKQHLFRLDWCCIAIAVFRIKFISSQEPLTALAFPWMYVENKFITYEIARLGSSFTTVVILRRKKFISRIFSQHRLLGEKRKDTWIYEDKKNAKNT